MSWFRLNKPMGTNYRVDPNDIKNTKQALNDLGYYNVPPHRGIDDWTDDAMFTGIRSFQKDNALKVDGFMRPEGPTEKAINQKLSVLGGNADKAPSQETCAQPAGWGMFGKTGGKCPRPGGNDGCDAQYASDGRICNGVSARLGKEAGNRCWRSASERLAACIAGRPEPPLSGGW